MRINALLSGFNPVALRGGENVLPFSDGTPGSAKQDSAAADAFAPTAGALGREETAAEPSGASEGVKSVPAVEGQQKTEPGKESSQNPAGSKAVGAEALTQAERLQVAELTQIDTKVRAHEQAHLAAAGSYATGGANFQYAIGPDGKQYAVGGEVGIDTGKESSPEATIGKMQTVRAAALAPADPSPQDQKVAARASLVIAEASQELRLTRLEQAKGKAGTTTTAQTETGEKAVAPEDQQAKGAASGQQISGKARQAASIMAGLSRPASRIHITV